MTYKVSINLRNTKLLDALSGERYEPSSTKLQDILRDIHLRLSGVFSHISIYSEPELSVSVKDSIYQTRCVFNKTHECISGEYTDALPNSNNRGTTLLNFKYNNDNSIEIVGPVCIVIDSKLHDQIFPKSNFQLLKRYVSSKRLAYIALSTIVIALSSLVFLALPMSLPLLTLWILSVAVSLNQIGIFLKPVLNFFPQDVDETRRLPAQLQQIWLTPPTEHTDVMSIINMPKAPGHNSQNEYGEGAQKCN